MDALLMCGGRGTRLDADAEKPLQDVGGRPMVDRVHEALVDSAVEQVHVVGSPHAPRTREHCERRLRVGDDSSFEAPGDGYVADLQYALERVGTPALTVASDLPLLAADAVDDVLAAHSAHSLAVCVPAALKRRLGASIDTTWVADGRELAPAGLNVVGAGDAEETMVTYDARLAVNVNRPADVSLAEALL